jgi:two-component sensor histidine kinase
MGRFSEPPPSGRCSSDERLLLYEYTHRINNEFTSAICAISIAAARSSNDEAKAALADVGDLLRNYARVHSALRMPEHTTNVDAGAYLGQLCLAIARSKLDRKGIELVFVERPLVISSECCWRLGMIVAELVTNAVRHAFRERGGVIEVELIPSRSFVECRVTDNGTSEAEIHPGNGLRIVQALAKGLNGKIDQHFGPRGATSILSFPYASPPVDEPCAARAHAAAGPPQGRGRSSGQGGFLSKQ